MTRYQNFSGASGVCSYELGSDFVKVMFADRMIYTYTIQSAGQFKIQTMKQLAVAGRGLNSFINTCAKKLYSSKGRSF